MSAETEKAARVQGRLLEAANPWWIVVFGVYTKEFVCFPRFSVPGCAIVAAKDPSTLPPRMREVEKSALRTSVMGAAA